MEIGCQSMVGKIEAVLVKHTKEAFVGPDQIQSQWESLNYYGCPDYDKARAEYEAFVSLLSQHIPEIHFLPADARTGLDSIYTHDPLLVTKLGAILCNMGKVERSAEPAAAGDCLKVLGIPVLGAIEGAGRLEGGDVLWLDEETLAVGRGYRTNEEGIEQLRRITRGLVREIIQVDLPHWRGRTEVLHLMSLVSPIDDGLALVHSRLLPVSFRERLIDRGMRLLELPEAEFDSMGCNVLAVAPGRCIMLAGNPDTRRLLERAGVEVMEFSGEEISIKGAGGPTCLTRPILRR